ncbi:unnamed protein product [Euphydryas editha]|nr:unnamed protein product [Euphydryas editha]
MDDTSTLREHLREGEEDALLALYADNSAYFASSYHNIVATNKMKRLLDGLPEWLDKWRMAVNVGKTTHATRTGRIVEDLSEVPGLLLRLEAAHGS